MQREIVRLVLERERSLDGLERRLGSVTVAAVKALAADGLVVRHGERLWASPCVSRLEAWGWWDLMCWYAQAMPDRSRKRPRDPNQLGKLIVGLATGEAEELNPDEGKNPAAVALGRKGGLKGGKARAENMTPG